MSGYQVDGVAQFFTMAIAAAVGGGLCLVYDVFRIMRHIKRPSGFSALVQDVAWWLIAAVATWLLLLVRCAGVVRIYALLAIAVGFVCCRFSVSILFMKIMLPAVDGIKRFLTPIYKGCRTAGRKCAKTCKNILISVKNLLKHAGAVVYNQLKSRVGIPFRKRSEDNGQTQHNS